MQRDLQIAADIGRLKDAREWAGGLADAAGMDADDCFQVKLAMSEAVTNAILHGSGAPTDTVALSARSTNGLLIFEIRDCANREPTSEDWIQPVGDGGRGLELISLMMDEVQLTRSDDCSILRFSKAV